MSETQEQTLLRIVETARDLGAIPGPAPRGSVWVILVRDPEDLSTWRCGLQRWEVLLAAEPGLAPDRAQADRFAERMEPVMVGLHCGTHAAWALGTLILREQDLPELRRCRAAATQVFGEAASGTRSS